MSGKSSNCICRNAGKLQNISAQLRTIILSRLFNSVDGMYVILPDDTKFHVTSSKFDSMSLVELATVLEACFTSENANQYFAYIKEGIGSFNVDLSKIMPSLVNWEEHILPPLIDYLDKFHDLYLFLYPRWVGAEKDRPKIEPPKNVQHGN